MKLCQRVFPDEISDVRGHVGPKTSSLGQILEKPYVQSRGLTLCPIIMMKSCRNLKMGHVWLKTRLIGQILQKTLCLL